MADSADIKFPKDDYILYEKFQKFREKELIRRAYMTFFNEHAALFPREIRQCDADTNEKISKATCSLKNFFNFIDGKCSGEIYPFGSIFERGMEILKNIAGSERCIPEDYDTKVLLDPLLSFLFDEDSHIALRKLDDEAENETQLMMTLAIHFFCKLSASSGCTMNRYATREGIIKLKDFEVSASFGDTSIGHEDVWHGNLDIVLESSQIGVHCTQSLEDVPGGRRVMDQALAQTITFSFLQQQLHPAMKHFLIPSILASSKAVQFCFYDSKNDILLQSKPFPFFINTSLNYQTVLAAWLVLNYKYLCSGPTPNILRAPKADFPKFAGASLEIYKTKLKFQNVAEETEDDPWAFIESGYCSDLICQWPENLAKHLPHS